MSKYREVKYHEVFEKSALKWAEEAVKDFNKGKYVVKSVDEVLARLEDIYTPEHKKKVQWLCKEAASCPQETCYHNSPHEWDEDCYGEVQCSRGIVVDGCCRVGGPKHKQISEGRCKDLWED
jgi:hypothetical protein